MSFTESLHPFASFPTLAAIAARRECADSLATMALVDNAHRALRNFADVCANSDRRTMQRRASVSSDLLPLDTSKIRYKDDSSRLDDVREIQAGDQQLRNVQQWSLPFQCDDCGRDADDCACSTDYKSDPLFALLDQCEDL